MKIRSSFVTNSSSSSFVLMKIKSDKLSEIMEVFRLYDGFDKLEYVINTLEDGSIQYHEDESGWYECPTNLKDAISFLLTLLTNDEELYIHENEDENNNFDLSEYESDRAPLIHRLAATIFRNRNEIMEDVEVIEVEYAESGYGGDDESRYDKGNYDEDTLKSIYEAIAEEKGISVDAVTDDDFDDYVGDKTSVAEDNFTFHRENGKETMESSNRYYLE